MTDPVTTFTAVLRTEAEALARLADRAGDQREALTAACARIQGRTGDGLPGRLVVTGVGKAGHIGAKLAATFASTGTPALFLHPAEARHGDLGMVQATDVVLAISNSGASEEVLAILPSLRLIGTPLIALVGRTDSPLARHAEVVLSIGPVLEACPLGLAPSTSTTALLALGDALALTIQSQRRFTPEQYARYHPGGALGRKLMTCAEAMRSGDRLPAVGPTTAVIDCLKVITSARAGSVLVVADDRTLLGIFTDGDLRRRLMSGDPSSVLARPVADVATTPGLRVQGTDLVEAAIHQCSQRKINELPVVDDAGRLIGLLDLQDLADRGFHVS